MKRRPPQLVLFDIDGTLVRGSPKGKAVEIWKERISAIFSDVYGMSLPFALELKDFNGLVDVGIFWRIAQKLGVSRPVFEKTLPASKDVYHQLLKQALTGKRYRYVAVEEAHTFVRQLKNKNHADFGLITGNIEVNAWLKL